MKKNFQIIIIGFGNIGKRHYESIINKISSSTIYLVDIKIKESDEFCKTNRIIKTNTILKHNLKFDLCIFSSNSMGRINLLKNFLKYNTAKKIIFEKIAFSSSIQYNEVMKLIKPQSSAFINCPRRIWKSYIDLKKTILKDRLINIQVSGYNWGILSNSIHFIDLLAFLSNDKNIKFLFSNCSNPFPSKREKYYEVFGSVVFENFKGNLLLLNDIKNLTNKTNITIYCQKYTYIIDEQDNKLLVINNNTKKEKELNFNTYFQSEISIEYLSKFNDLKSLPNLQVSKYSHYALYEFFSTIFPKNTKFPVT